MRERYGAGVWKAIKNGLEDFKVRTRFRVKSGNRVKFWKDRWQTDLSLRDAFPNLFSITSFKNAQVVDVWDGGSWNPRFIRQLNDWELKKVNNFFGRQHDHSLSMDSEDLVEWADTKSGVFSIRSFYSPLANRRADPFPHGIIWNSWALVRVSFFAREATWAKTLTLDQLGKRSWKMLHVQRKRRNKLS